MDDVARAYLGPKPTDPLTAALCTELQHRAQAGRAKYGVALADAGLSRAELLQHAKEEALDLACYLQALLMTGSKSMSGKSTMTPGEALEEMRKLPDDPYEGDQESDHARGDEILCALLRHLGQNEIVDEWEKRSSGWWWA